MIVRTMRDAELYSTAPSYDIVSSLYTPTQAAHRKQTETQLPHMVELTSCSSRAQPSPALSGMLGFALFGLNINRFCPGIRNTVLRPFWTVDLGQRESGVASCCSQW